MKTHLITCHKCKKTRYVSRSMDSLVRHGHCSGQCISCGSKGNKRRLGSLATEETKKKMSLAHLGIKKSSEHCKNISRAQRGAKKPHTGGENHYLWNVDRTKVMEKHRVRGTIEWRDWREFIFTRDNFQCIDCGENGTNLEPHHIIPLASNMGGVFDKNNGITLCRPCHQKTIRKESELARTYFSLVQAHV